MAGMRAPLSFVQIVVFTALLLVARGPALAASEPLAGRTVSDVLRSLEGPGVQFIFSSALLPPSLVVLEEPHAADALGKAREVLRAHSLTLRTFAPGRYAIVKDPSAPAPVVRNNAQAAPGPQPLTEVVVSTSRYVAGADTPPESFVLAGSDLAAQPSLGDDSLRALARLPGMAQSGLSAQSNVRGGEAGEVLTLLDGYPLRQAFHAPAYQSLFSILDPGVIDSAQVYTGGFPARYGNRMSGVFDLTTIDGRTLPKQALGLSFFNATAMQAGVLPSIGTDYLVAGRVGTLKPFIQAFSPRVGSPSYSDALGRVGIGDASRLRVTGNFLWARDELSISSRSRGERAEIESRSRYIWLRAEREWSEDLSASLWLGHTLIDSVRQGTLDSAGIARGSVLDSRASEFGDLRGQLEWQMAPAHYVEVGFEGTHEEADYRYASTAEYSAPIMSLFDLPAVSSTEASFSTSRDRVALFGTHRWQLTNAVTTELGLRMQRLLTNGGRADWMEDPRLSVRVQLTGMTTLRAHWGRFHQADEVHELAVDEGLTAFTPPQRSDQLIIGLEHRFDNAITLRVEGFRKDQSTPRPRFENTLSSLWALPEIAPDRTRVEPQFAEIRGMELLASQQTPHSTRWASLVWSVAEDEIGGREVPRGWDQTWSVAAGLELRGSRWRAGAVATAHRGWPRTDLVLTDGELQLGDRNGKRFPIYATLDLRAERWHTAWGGTLAYAVEITNALNRRNRCCTELSSIELPDGTSQIASRERAWLPLIPSLSVRWEH